MSELASYELENGIATIAMDDGKVNAFSIAMLRTLHEALDQAERDEAVVILTGREGRFSAGFDLKVFTEQPDQLLEMLTLGATLCERILAFANPVVVACNGHAVAAGAFVPMAADVRIGVDGAFKIGLNEVQIGLTVPWFVIELARHRLAPAHFDRALVTGRMHTPAEAVEAGFLDRLVTAEELGSAAREAATELAALDRGAHAATKLRARESAIRAIRAAIESELVAVEPAS